MTEAGKCAICGKEYPLQDMRRYFTGRARYVCFKCENKGEIQVSAKRDEFFSSAAGQKLIERNRRVR